MSELTPLEMLSNNYSFYMKQKKDKKEEQLRQRETIHNIQEEKLHFLAELNNKVQNKNDFLNIKSEQVFNIKRLNIFAFLGTYYEFILHFKEHFEVNQYYPSFYHLNKQQDTIQDILNLFMDNNHSNENVSVEKQKICASIDLDKYLFLSVQKEYRTLLEKEQEVSYIFYQYLSQIDKKIYHYFMAMDIDKMKEFTDMTSKFSYFNNLFHTNKYLVDDKKLLYVVFNDKWDKLTNFLNQLVDI